MLLRIILFYLRFIRLRIVYFTETGDSFVSNLIKGLAPLGAPLASTGSGVGVPDVSGVVPGVPFNTNRRGCPLCDSSVYSYCSLKMVHDACCCSGGKMNGELMIK